MVQPIDLTLTSGVWCLRKLVWDHSFSPAQQNGWCLDLSEFVVRRGCRAPCWFLFPLTRNICIVASLEWFKLPCSRCFQRGLWRDIRVNWDYNLKTLSALSTKLQYRFHGCLELVWYGQENDERFTAAILQCWGRCALPIKSLARNTWIQFVAIASRKLSVLLQWCCSCTFEFQWMR